MYRISRREFLTQFGLVTAAGVLASCVNPVVVTTTEEQAAAPAAAAKEIAPGVLRADTLILENPTGRVVPADDFNR